jgi:iron(III) transport system ATP-binding protein
MLRVSNLSKTFVTSEGEVSAVRNVSFEVDDGVCLTLLGPSGCGKTTTLRMVGGLENPDNGEIEIGETVFSGSKGILVPAHRRGIGMVFQSYAIWPHMTVFQNVAFPLVRGGFKLPKSDVKERVRKALELVGLAGYENRPAPFLSGGQQQRVAVARAVVYEPKLLLLDEPLSNVDAKLRDEMRFELRSLIDKLKISTLYVTHDQEEALVLSDEIAVMNAGEILQRGGPRDIYLDPTDPFVASFVGNTNFIAGRVEGSHVDENMIVTAPFGQVVCVSDDRYAAGDSVTIAFRPEDVLIRTEFDGSESNTFPGMVQHKTFLGNRFECEIQVGTVVIHADVGARTNLEQGEEIAVRIPPKYIRLLRTS